jgi:hypothetical protein
MDIAIQTATLHSKYDPWKEAERYLRHTSISSDSRIYLLIEPGKGYLTQLLHTRNPDAKLIEVHCNEQMAPIELSAPAAQPARWSPGSNCSLFAFLAHHIADLDIGSVEVVEWPPAERAFGDVYSRIKTGVRHFLQERRATVHTTGKFGRLWLRNTIKRVAALPPLMENLKVHSPIIIAASGPSLSKSTPLLRKYRKSLFIMALPSALPALAHAGIQTDMVVHSDPGFFAEYHLRLQPSSENNMTVAIEAAPLYSKGYRQEFPRFFWLSTTTPSEQFFAHALDITPMSLASHGTVAGIALQLALELIREDSQPVFFCGLDFCFDDILGHTTPHSFDPLLFSVHSRLEPIQEIFYKRSPKAHAGNRSQTYALERYSAWFQKLPSSYRNQVYRLFPSEVEIDAFTDIDAAGFEHILTRYSGGTQINNWTAETQRIPHSKAKSALVHYSHTLHSQYQEISALDARRLLQNMRNYPLLLEFVQYTDYPLLFRLQRGTADFFELQRTVERHLDEIDSIIRAVQMK